jgi:hypothetical protein
MRKNKIFIGVIGAGDCSEDVYKLAEQETGRRFRSWILWTGKSRKKIEIGSDYVAFGGTNEASPGILSYQKLLIRRWLTCIG